MLIPVEIVWRRIVCDQEVDPTVVVHVDKNRCKSKIRGCIGDASFFADVGECAVAVVVEETISLARYSARPAHHVHPAKLTRIRGKSALARARRMIRIELHVAGNKQIKQAVVIVVAPCWPGRPPAERDAGFFRDVGKRSVVIVVVEAILSVVRNVNVGPTIVVVIADSDAEAPAFVRHASLVGYVRKRSIGIIVKEHRSWRRLFSKQGGDGRAIQNVNVEPAVVVVVEQCHAGTGRLDDHALIGIAGAVTKFSEPGLLSNVDEYDESAVDKSTRRDGTRFIIFNRRMRRASRYAGGNNGGLLRGFLIWWILREYREDRHSQ